MHRVIIRKNGDIVKSVLLEASEYTIGRNSKSDIHLNDLSISRKHARLVQVQNDFYIEDLGSTNGTRHNDIKVKRHILKDDDLVQIGGFGLLYVNHQADGTDLGKKRGVQSSDSAARQTNDSWDLPEISPTAATVRFFHGPKEGQLERINRSLYTIGRPGGEVAAITRRKEGFFLLSIGGETHPKINDQEISTSAGVQLNEGDLLEVGEHLIGISLDDTETGS